MHYKTRRRRSLLSDTEWIAHVAEWPNKVHSMELDRQKFKLEISSSCPVPESQNMSREMFITMDTNYLSIDWSSRREGRRRSRRQEMIHWHWSGFRLSASMNGICGTWWWRYKQVQVVGFMKEEAATHIVSWAAAAPEEEEELFASHSSSTKEEKKTISFSAIHPLIFILHPSSTQLACQSTIVRQAIDLWAWTDHFQGNLHYMLYIGWRERWMALSSFSSSRAYYQHALDEITSSPGRVVATSLARHN